MVFTHNLSLVNKILEKAQRMSVWLDKSKLILRTQPKRMKIQVIIAYMVEMPVLLRVFMASKDLV